MEKGRQGGFGHLANTLVRYLDRRCGNWPGLDPSDTVLGVQPLPVFCEPGVLSGEPGQGAYRGARFYRCNPDGGYVED